MSKRLCIYIVFLLIAIAIENTVTTLPLVLVLLLFFSVMKQRQLVFFLAFVSGLLLDVFSLRLMGETSLFFLVFLFLSMQYERKFHIASIYFVAVSSFIGSFLYLLLFGYSAVFLQSIISVMLSILLYLLYRIIASSSQKRPDYST